MTQDVLLIKRSYEIGWNFKAEILAIFYDELNFKEKNQLHHNPLQCSHTDYPPQWRAFNQGQCLWSCEVEACIYGVILRAIKRPQWSECLDKRSQEVVYCHVS